MDELAGEKPEPTRGDGVLSLLGASVVTGAADDDPSAIGTYASAGAKYGLGFLWIAPVVLPMMVVVVYLAAKLGQVTGKGLFAAVRDRFPRWVLYPIVIGAVAGNVIEAAADLGGIGAALNLLVPVPVPLIVIGAAGLVVAFQLFGSYAMLRAIFRWLALALFAYVGAAILARPDLGEVARGTFIPHIEFTVDFLAMIVASIGTSLSAYIYTWQSNQEVEDRIAQGRRSPRARRGATHRELKAKRADVFTGMLFANVILYAIILSTGATLHKAGHTDIDTAAQAAAALEPLAGSGAKYLFALGVVGVGILAVPVMTTGAAYDLVQGFGGDGSLHDRVGDAKPFYAIIVVVTILAVAMNFLGFNPMRMLVWSGVVQGFSVPPLLVLMMLMTNDRAVLGDKVNGTATKLLGWTTVAVTALAAGGLVVTWLV